MNNNFSVVPNIPRNKTGKKQNATMDQQCTAPHMSKISYKKRW